MLLRLCRGAGVSRCTANTATAFSKRVCAAERANSPSGDTRSRSCVRSVEEHRCRVSPAGSSRDGNVSMARLGGEALPLVGIAVTSQQGTAVRRTVTDADGRFVFVNVAAGDHKVTADLPRAYDRVLGQNASVRVGCYGYVDIFVYRVPLQGTLETEMGDGSPPR